MKEGHPVPDSNLEEALKRGVLQPPQLHIAKFYCYKERHSDACSDLQNSIAVLGEVKSGLGLYTHKVN